LKPALFETGTQGLLINIKLTSSSHCFSVSKSSGGNCFLAVFVTSCIEQVLIPQVGNNLHRSLDRSSAKSPDMWREMTTLADQKRYRLHRPVLKVRKI
jgi:hypothetical protein